MEKMKKMMEKMSEEEMVRMMERCFEFMKEKEGGKDKERKERKREESACIPDMGKMAECRPEMMETFFLKMKGCFEGKGKGEKNNTDEKTEKPGCCKRI
ncbi:MAG: hypothetical protein WBX49_07200 [Candidatus Deferrimicrobiaceae bacterium]